MAACNANQIFCTLRLRHKCSCKAGSRKNLFFTIEINLQMFIASTIFLFFISPPLFSSPSPNSVFFSSHFKLYNCLFPSFLLWIVGALLNQIRGVYGSIVKYLPSRAQRRYCLVIQERRGREGGPGPQEERRVGSRVLGL